MQRRARILMVAAVAGLGLALTACGSGNGGGSSAAEPAAEPVASATESPTGPPARDPDAALVLWADDAKAQVLQPFLEEFAEENGITAVVQTVNDNGRDSFVTATLAENGPDLVVGAHDWIGKFVENGVIAPVPMSAEVQEQFLPNSIEAATSDGSVYGVPYAVENIGLIRNTELAPDVPGTVEEMLALGNELVASGKASKPMVMPVGQEGDPYHAEPFITSAGGYVFGRDAEGDYDPADLGLDGAEGAAVAEKLAWMTEQGALSTSITFNEALDLFVRGETPFLVTGPWATGDIADAGINYAVSEIPPFEGGQPTRPFVGVQLFYVSSKAENATFAQEFALRYVSRPDVQRALFEQGQRPPALASLNAELSAADPELQAWSAAGANGDPMPSIPAMDAVWGPLGIAIANIAAGEGDPNQIMTDAASAITEAIGQ
ncbi:sugar ABC transporter substrate-binding protein [Tessaracoccus sp. Y36]